VDYHGPNDEIGQLATTFNAMLARLHQAYQRVSQALSLQRQFVADVSHELRTPLTTVRGNLELLRRGGAPHAREQTDILNDLVSESDRLIRLVNDLLLLARADAGRSLLHEPVALQPLVEESYRQAQQLDCQRQITVSVPEVSVLGDRDALKQVLLILLDNAIKYSKGAIEVIGDDRGLKVFLAVKDKGPGIDPSELQLVFDRFFRSEVSLDVPGFGLGLPIARSLVEDQGAEINLQNQPDGGVSVEHLLTKS
jgi:signal transduction histidine kinase